MNLKAKGTRLERELLHMFHKEGFSPMRAAGSGSTILPCADLIVAGKERILAIECKGGKGKRYIEKRQVDELVEFSKNFNAEPWVATRFDNNQWWFIEIDVLKKSKGGNYIISLEESKKIGRTFEEILKYKKDTSFRDLLNKN
ncbi:Holliday junction resolvase [Candidatus Woesearchaeota archaeon]|nr:Holliday junction resolvase [Candidatus Woesearchaeota archaeon]